VTLGARRAAERYGAAGAAAPGECAAGGHLLAPGAWLDLALWLVGHPGAALSDSYSMRPGELHRQQWPLLRAAYGPRPRSRAR